MKIGIAGTFNRDTIVLPDGKRKNGWGGILYNVVALSKAIGAHHKIYPTANIGYDAYATVSGMLKKLRGVQTEYLNKVAEKNNHCFLTYIDYENKNEILKGGVKPLKYDNIRPLLDCDIVLLNYISGRDVYLQSLRKFRKQYAGKIYIDIHSLTLGKRKNGRRYLRIPPNWMVVVENGDYIQMNRQELELLTANGKRIANNKAKPEEQLSRLVKILGNNQVKVEKKVFVTTAGDLGCYLYFKSGGKWRFDRLAASEKAARKDTTGCGDCFSAGFIAGLIEGQNLFGCARRANRIALDRIQGRFKII
jgi:hypothetical protein